MSACAERTPTKWDAAYRAAIAGVVNQSELALRGSGPNPIGEPWMLYDCPACGRAERCGHYATRSVEGFGGSASPCSVLHCRETGRQWFVRTDVQGTVAREEEKFWRLMDKFEREGLLGKRVTAAEAFGLYTERGCPPECLDVDDQAELDRLMRRHSEVSRGRA